MLRKLLSTLLVFALLPMAVQANPAQARVEGFLKDLSTLRADFTQTVTDGQGRLIDNAHGVLMLGRPGRFRWDYVVPEQRIVSDGKNIWLYDVELAQVTVRDANTALAGTPAELLSGVGELGDSFTFEDGGESDGMAWSRLQPRSVAGDFQEIRLGFTRGMLTRMELSDRLGQVTRLRFERIERNPRLGPGVFNFDPPPGVDVLGTAAP